MQAGYARVEHDELEAELLELGVAFEVRLAELVARHYALRASHEPPRGR